MISLNLHNLCIKKLAICLISIILYCKFKTDKHIINKNTLFIFISILNLQYLLF